MLSVNIRIVKKLHYNVVQYHCILYIAHIIIRTHCRYYNAMIYNIIAYYMLHIMLLAVGAI